MKNILFLAFISLTYLLVNCTKKTEQETILKGNTSILVDESLRPIINEQVEIFESRYESKINLISKSENEIIQSLVRDTTKIAVLTRKLSKQELAVFASRKIKPRETLFATDAIVLVSNKSTKDSLITVEQIIDFLKENKSTSIKGLVFDNPNSSSVRYLNELAGITSSSNKNIYSFKTNKEVIKYVAQNNGMIGVVGLNWIEQINNDLKNITILSIKNPKTNLYIYPSQNSLAEKTYPLARDLYIINCQGYSGLGMGFSSFVAGEVGQRIVLKSGLLPFKTPGRNIIIRNKIEKEKQVN